MYPSAISNASPQGLQQYIPQNGYADPSLKESGFSLESQRLVNNIAMLETTLGELFKRLQPVLTPISSGTAARDGAPTPTRSTVVQAIAASADRVLVIQQALTSIIGSLEV